jgi:hypothetical protein
MAKASQSAVLDQIEPLRNLDRDLRASARLLGRFQARNLVDLYYQVQEYRKRGANQTRAGEAEAEPTNVVYWVYDQTERLENNIRRALGEFAGAYRVGQWMQGQTGIGPVISAGLLAHLDIRRSPTAGHFWRFAGLDPSVRWESTATCQSWLKEQFPHVALADLPSIARTWGRDVNTLTRFSTTDHRGNAKKLTLDGVAKALSRRPWNADLKRLCWIAGDCFVKFSNHPKQYYGTIYNERKTWEAGRNADKAYADQAAHSLATKRFGADTIARKQYEQGLLPDARIHMRGLRYTVKMFLSHLHHVMHTDFFGRPPGVPYAFAKATGDHRHFVPLPNWMEEDPWEAYDGKSLTDLLVD